MSVSPFGYHRGGSFVRRTSQSTPLMIADGWTPLYEGDPALAIEHLLAEIKRLERLVYVPGALRCPKCKFSQVSANLHVDVGAFSANNDPAPCPNGCGPLWRHTERDAGNELLDRIEPLAEKAAKYDAINTPEIHNFMVAIEREALHQRERWNAEHDAGKTDQDWFWLIGYLAGKALHKPEKRLHHIITTAAACLNWHAHALGVHKGMRPGIEQPKDHA
jgi:hypothetical protein